MPAHLPVRLPAWHAPLRISLRRFHYPACALLCHRLRALASRFGVDWDAADFDQLVRLGTQLSNSVNCFINRERPGVSAPLGVC